MTDVLSEAGGSPLTGKDVLLSVRNLTAGFETDDGRVQAVDGVSFDVSRGEVFSIVGESANLALSDGTVQYKVPGAAEAETQEGPTQIPIGTQVDTTEGAADVV